MGFITGNVPGAVIGANVAGRVVDAINSRQQVSRIKMVGGSVINALAGRASMKRKSSSNIKQVKGKKSVKVSKKLRKQIKQVTAGTGMYGSFTKMFKGSIGNVCSDTAFPTVNIAGYSNALACVYPPASGQNDNNVTYWHVPMSSGLPNAAGGYLVGTDFNFFTPAKVLDAASVLWNNKTVALDYTSTTGNFQTRTDGVSGTPSTTYPTAAKVMVKNAWVEFTLKNNSQRAVKIVAYHCTPKTKFASLLPLDQLNYSHTNDYLDSGTMIYESTQNASTLTSPIIPWKDYPSFSSTWKYETVEINLGPGETCKHSIQGPRNIEIDFAKLIINGTNAQRLVTKGSISVVFAVIPDYVYATQTRTTPTVTNVSGRFVKLADAINHSVSMEVCEKFKLYMPENAGFTQQAVTAGNVKQLDMRKPRKAYLNFATSDVQEGNLVYSMYNEENIAAAIAASFQS